MRALSGVQAWWLVGLLAVAALPGCATGPARAPETPAGAPGGQDAGSAPESQWSPAHFTQDPFGATFDSDGGTWNGCRSSGGKEVCAGLVTPSYFQEHPGCTSSAECRGVYFTCHAECPPPRGHRPAPPPSIPREEREAGFKAFDAALKASRGLSVQEAEAILEKMVREHPVFEAAGVKPNGSAWARFRDGRLLIAPRPHSGR